jgi:hypothetical protein
LIERFEAFDIADLQNIVGEASAASRNPKGDFHGSNCDQRVTIPVSMDPTRDGNATGTVEIRDLPALP